MTVSAHVILLIAAVLLLVAALLALDLIWARRGRADAMAALRQIATDAEEANRTRDAALLRLSLLESDAKLGAAVRKAMAETEA